MKDKTIFFYENYQWALNYILLLTIIYNYINASWLPIDTFWDVSNIQEK